MAEKLIFGFDVGIGSLGIAVRRGDEIIDADSLLIDADVAGLQDERERRRAKRTRDAHKNREEALVALWGKIGEEPLIGGRYKEIKPKGRNRWQHIPGDKRLEREFPAKGDETIYTSCLLRVSLLEGKKLEPWQIFKALHSAIQRRGYDTSVPWGKTPERKSKKEDEKINKARTDDFAKEVKKISPNTNHHYPCYLDAYRIGLWKNGKILSSRIFCKRSGRARNSDTTRQDAEGNDTKHVIPPRELVSQEIKHLLKQAGLQLPKLKPYIDTDEKLDTLLYGERNSSLPEKYRQYPSPKLTSALLAQKLPRFDNRCVGKCCLIPRLKVCKKTDELFLKVRFLLELLNFRYNKTENENSGASEVYSLLPEQVKKYYKEKDEQWKKKKLGDVGQEQKAQELNKIFQWTSSQVNKIVDDLGGHIREGHASVPKIEELSGRCRYSRPALALLLDMILSENWSSPVKYGEMLLANCKPVTDMKDNHGDKWIVVSGKKFRIFERDLDFLSRIKDTANHFYIPSTPLAYQYEGTNDDNSDHPKESIKKLISECSSPRVRHRLTFFASKLEELIATHGTPNHVAIEFVREDFMGEKQKKKHEKLSKEGQKEKKDAIGDLKKEEGIVAISDKRIEMARLIRQQSCVCLYTGESLSFSDDKMKKYDIDHILPLSKGGPDALFNKVVTGKNFNQQDKVDKIPYEVNRVRSEWDSFTQRVQQKIKGHNNKARERKKVKILLSTSIEEAQELAEKYTGLAATAWIARLARDIVCLRMPSWIPGKKGETKNITVISGGLTNKIAKKNHLYECLGDGSQNHKNRADKRHHALDAMIITYLAGKEWARDKDKTDFFELPKGITKDYFSKILDEKVNPQIVRPRGAKLCEQPYARRQKNAETREYEMIKSGKTTPYNPLLHKNLKKDKSAGKGHWYESHRKKPGGIRFHGRLIVYPNNNEPADQINHVPIHAHTSPWRMSHHHRSQGRKVVKLRRGDLVEINENLGQNLKAIQKGEEIYIKKSEHSKFEIIGMSRESDYLVSRINESEKEPNKFYVTRKIVADIYKYKEAVDILRSGGKRAFDKELKSNDGTTIKGVWEFDGAAEYRQDVKLSNNKNETKEIKFKLLLKYIKENFTLEYKDFTVGDSITIDRSIPAKSVDKPNSVLSAQIYRINNFDAGDYVIIATNKNVLYKVAIKELAKAINIQCTA